MLYSSAITRKREIEEGHVHPGGVSPAWVRYITLGVTIIVLAVTFWLSVETRTSSQQRRAPLPRLLEETVHGDSALSPQLPAGVTQ